MKYRIGRDRLDIVKTSSNCAVVPATNGPQPVQVSRLEQSLLKTGRADVIARKALERVR